MRYLKTLAYSIKNSLTSVDYYNDVVKAPFTFSYKYFLALSFIIAIIYSLSFVLVDSRNITQGINKAFDQVKSTYPDDLVIIGRNGSITTNQAEPYIVPMPESIKTSETYTDDMGNSKPTPENLIVFDSNGTLEKMDEYKTAILVNSVNILVKTPSKTEVRSTKDFPDFTLDKAQVAQQLAKIEKFTKLIPLIGLIAVFAASFGFYAVIKLIDVAINSLIVLIVSKFMNTHFSFGEMVKITLHTSTIPYILEALISVLKPDLHAFPGILFVLNAAIALFVVYRLTKKKLHE